MNLSTIRLFSLVTLVVWLLVACSQPATNLPDQPTPTLQTPAPDENATVGIQAVTSQIAMETGSFHSCAIVSGGAVKCWGRNSSGQLGNSGNTNSSTPVDVTGLSSGATSIGAGSSHTCAVVSGGAKCWGWNFNGQLGTGNNNSSNTPVDVTGLTSGVSAIAAGGNHSCALTTGGGVKCWGDNLYGELGNGTTTSSNTPVDVTGLSSGVQAISVGLNHTCALTVGGGVKCWGRNGNGQLGNPANAGNAGGTNPTPLDVTGLSSGVTAISAGGFHTCAVAGGGVKCWGRNSNGQLGSGSNSESAAPVDVSGLGSGATAVGAGYTHTCAVVGGGAKCWGNNLAYQLGDGSNTSSNIPVDVNGLASGTARVSGGDFHSCALSTVGGIKCWGENSSGQLGNSSTFDGPFPVGVTDMNPDGTPPNITPVVSGTLGDNGWYTSDVTVSWSVSDPDGPVTSRIGCGIQNIIADTTATGVSFTCSATSAGGSSSRSVSVKVDKTAPTITLASRLPAANAAGWNNADVNLVWNCADALSGVVSSTVLQTINTEGANQSAVGTCKDLAGNTTSNSQTVSIDKTRPTIAAAATTPPNANGWYASNLTVRFTCADNASGVVSCPADQTLSSEGNAVSSTAQTVTDQAGNISNPSNLVTAKIDKTAPSITLASRLPAANGAGWNNADVTATWNCTDGGSGVVSSTVSQVVSSEGANQSASGTCTDNAGNSSSNTQNNISIDKTVPTVSAAATTAPNGSNGWYTSNVTVRFTCADNASGVVSCPTDQVLSSEGGSVSSTAQTVTDQAGNSSVPSNVVTVKIDKTIPTIALASRLPTPNPAGWNNSNVTVTWNCSDGVSGAVSATVNQTLSSEGNNLSSTGTCTDNAGNTVSDTQSGLKIDKTAPTISAAATSGPNGSNGWYTSNVTVRFSCSDNLSGVVACPADQTLSAEGNATSSTAQTITDAAGNSSSPSNVVTVRIDKTAPSIALASRLPAANGAGWNNTDVTVTWNCADTTSGVVSSTVSRTVSTQGSGQSAGQTCTNQAGLSATSTIGGINIDKTAPTLAPVVSPNPVLRNLSATATPNAADALSGLASSSCPAVPTSSAGLQSITCTATDRAGNTTTAPASYTVLSSSQALSNLRSQVQGLSGLGFVNRTLLLATLSQAQVYLSNGVRSGAVGSLNTFIGQVDGIRGISGGLTNEQANALIAQANLIIQSINAGG